MSPCCLLKIPKLYVTVALMALALLLTSAMRIAIPITLLEMGQRLASLPHQNNSYYCPPGANIVKPKSLTLSTWPMQTQELIVASFTWGCVASQVGGGVLSDVFGGRYVISVGVFGAAIVTLVTPVAVSSNVGYGLVMFLRITQGMFVGLVDPAVAAILGQWSPPQRKTSWAVVVFSGAHLGIAIVLISARRSHWKNTFYVLGALALVWCLLWLVVGFSSPQSHHWIKENEKDELSQALEGHVVYKKTLKEIPWKKIVYTSHVWGLSVAEVGHTWAYFVLLTELPVYMKYTLKFTTRETTRFSSIAFFILWGMSLVSGYLSDLIINKEWISATHTRLLFTTIGYTGSSMFLVAAACAGCHKMAFLGCLVVALVLMSTYNASIKVNVLDLSPNYAGFLMGIVQTMGLSVALVQPLIFQFLRPHETLAQWFNSFVVCFIVVFFTNAVYFSYGSAEEQVWNLKNKDEDDKN